VVFWRAQKSAGVSEANMPPVFDRWSPADFDTSKFLIEIYAFAGGKSSK